MSLFNEIEQNASQAAFNKLVAMTNATNARNAQIELEAQEAAQKLETETRRLENDRVWYAAQAKEKAAAEKAAHENAARMFKEDLKRKYFAENPTASNWDFERDLPELKSKIFTERALSAGTRGMMIEFSPM